VLVSRLTLVSTSIGRKSPANDRKAILRVTAANELAIKRALEAAGVEFIDENGGGPGVRLRKPQRSKQSK
jgi:hypothetical protein